LIPNIFSERELVHATIVRLEDGSSDPQDPRGTGTPKDFAQGVVALNTQRSGQTSGRNGDGGRRLDAAPWPHPARNDPTVPGVRRTPHRKPTPSTVADGCAVVRWPPAHLGGRNGLGQRLRKPLEADHIGAKAPDAAELGVTLEAVIGEIRRLQGLPPIEISERDTWPAHLKHATLVNIEAVKTLPLHHPEIRPYLVECLKYLEPEIFKGHTTPRTIRSTRLSDETITKLVEEYQKASVVEIKEPLPPDVHGVNMWLTPEMKIRARIMNEPFLNAAIAKHTLPLLMYPSRLRQLRRGRVHRRLRISILQGARPATA
jgi:hypothetical protein